MKERIVIIDGNSLINRAYYAMQRHMITKEGIYTQGIYGFINMLTKIQEDYSPSHITVAFDLKGPTFRHLEYDQYKAGRRAMPMELAMEMPILKDVLKAMNIHTMELEGFEADDLIGTVSRMAEENGMEPLVVTGDKDALQLASYVTKIIITKKGVTDFEIYDHDKMLERYSLTPAQFIDLKGLMGDSSDNIPGIPGVGEKTGISLLTQFGSIENMLEHTEEIKKDNLRKKVEEGQQLALMSKRLATINRFVPIEIDFSELKFTEPNYKELISLYTKLEFKSFLKKIKTEDSEEVSDIAISETIEKTMITDEGGMEKLSSLKDGKAFIKVFSDFSHVKAPTVDYLFIGTKEKVYLLNVEAIGVESVIKVLNQLSLSFWGHDIKDDIYALMYYGLENFKVIFDTAIAEYVLETTRSNYDLKAMMLEKFQITIPSEKEYLTGKGQMDMFSDPGADYLEYGLILETAVSKVIESQKEALAEQGLENIFFNVEIPLIEVMASLEVEGICVNKEMLGEFGESLRAEIQVLEMQIHELAGESFNINSPLQLGNILFEKLMLPAGKKTQKGYSTGADILEKIKDKHPIVPAVMTYRNLTKLNSTYVEGLKPLIGRDGKIRAHFQQTVAATGRLSCTEPNLQNIPVRSELGRQLRQAFTAGEGRLLIGADYSQIELRILAHLSQDETLIEAFNNGEDIHLMTASRVLGVPADKITPGDRSKAKAVNFGVIYGMSGFGLSEELNITRKEAEAYIGEYFKKHVKVKEYMDQQIAKCKESGYSETIMGRKRFIHEINASQYVVRQLGERLAMNTPIQGSAADIIKLAMIKVYKALKEEFPESKLILQVHDELIIDAQKEDKEKIKELLVKNMEEAMELSVKLSAEPGEGATWYDLK